MSISITKTDLSAFARLIKKGESHFLDFKSKEIKPTKLTKALSAFANADGGELYVGIEERQGKFYWSGFSTVEDANGHIQALEQIFPLGAYFKYGFVYVDNRKGFVLQIDIGKTPDIRKAADGIVYIRRGAQSLPQTTAEQLKKLEYSKGITSFEDHQIAVDPENLTESKAAAKFMSEVVPTTTSNLWLKKQRLIVDQKPTVCGVLLFSDEPQIDLPKSNIKIYRYKTTAGAGTRETLAANPETVEGCLYEQIFAAVDRTKSMTEEIPLLGLSGLEKIEYPTEAVHEIVTNAVIHRDYSINDDVHIRIFDNRIEIQSPDLLPGHVTELNYLEERFARNPKIVRILNKYRNPPNKDVGEGLNTAFEAMRKLKLQDPVFKQLENSVLVVLKHEKLGTPEQIIVQYLKDHDEINNSIARSICFIGSENTMKRTFQKMIKSGLIQPVPGRSLNKSGYVKGPNFPTD